MIPVTFNQNRRLTFEEGLRRSRRPVLPYNICSAFALHVRTDPAALEAVLNAIARRHPGLRASFAPAADLSEGERAAAIASFQETGICPPDLYRQMIEADARIRVLPDSRELADTDTSLRGIAREFTAAPSFECGLSARVCARLFEVADGSQLLVLVLPHLVCDAVSLDVLAAELTAYQRSRWVVREPAAGTSHDWPPDAAAERDAQRRGALTAAADYWQAQWEAFESAQIARAAIPFALPVLRAPAGLVASERVRLDEQLSSQAMAFARSSRVTFYALCVAAVSLLIRRVLGVTRVAIWSNLPNRAAAGSQDAVGWFVHAHMFGVDLTAATSTRTLLHEVRRVVTDALAHQQLPLGLLWHKCQRCPVRGVRVGLDLIQHDGGASEGVRRIAVPAGRQGMVDLDFEIHVESGAITLVATYSVDLLMGYAVRQLLTVLQGIFASFVEDERRERVAVPAYAGVTPVAQD